MSQSSFAVSHQHGLPVRPPLQESTHSKEPNMLFRALIAAIVIHIVAICGLALAPAWQAKSGDLEEVHVFGSNKAAFMQPVKMVNLKELEEPTQPVVAVAPQIQPVPIKKIQPEPKVTPVVKSSPAPVQKTSVSPKQTGAKPNTQIYDPGGSSAPRTQNTTPAVTPKPARSGGGGGGGVRVLATATPNPAPSISVPANSGGTLQGHMPGTGTGSGSGSGTGVGTGNGNGSGSGSGDGTGSGNGSGNGTGTGNGSGNGVGNGRGGEGGGEGFNSRLADRSEPKVTRKGTFAYPASAAEDGVEGTVLLRVLVDENGRVANVEISSSARDKRLDEAAKDYVRSWRFLPAVQDGRARQVWTKAKVTFKLQ